MFEIKSLKHCNFEIAVETYNKGFEGYKFDKTLTADQFVKKLGEEGLSIDLSIIAFVDGEPAGIVLNGIRTFKGKKVGWNGGTGVTPNFRGKGISKKLIQKSLDLYRDKNLDMAALDSVTENIVANTLYHRMGFETVETAFFLKLVKQTNHQLFELNQPSIYNVQKGTQADLKHVPFMNDSYWSIQWAGLREKEALIITDKFDQIIGYALYKNVYDEKEEVKSFYLFDCDIDPTREDTKEIVLFILNHLFNHANPTITCMTYNLPSSRRFVVQLLLEEGFTLWNEEIFMVQTLA